MSFLPRRSSDNNNNHFKWISIIVIHRHSDERADIKGMLTTLSDIKSTLRQPPTYVHSCMNVYLYIPSPPLSLLSFILGMIIGNINITLSKSDRLVIYIYNDILMCACVWLIWCTVSLVTYRLEYKQEYEKFKLFNIGLISVLAIISIAFLDSQ